MKQKFKQHFIFSLMLILVIVSFLLIDYSSLAYFNPSNLRLIFEGLIRPDFDYLYQKGSSEDLLSLMLDTLAIAFYGTSLGTILSIPFALLSANNLWNKWSFIPKITRGILNLLRSIPTLIYAILFVRIVGPGEFAGALAIGIQLIGMLGKLMGEALDNIDETPVEAMISVGATNIQVFQHGRLSQVLPMAMSHILNHFEISVRSATILGLVGAGGIGAPIIFSLQSRNWERVSIILLAIIIVVIIIDQLSSVIRRHLT